MTVPPALIDTNILTYAFDTGEPEKRRICTEILARCWRRECEYAVSVQNLAEFYCVVTEKIEYPEDPAAVEKFFRLIMEFNGWHVIGYQPETILAAHTVTEKTGLHFWDALLVATMREHKIDTIFTEDRGFSLVPGLTVINPFEPL